jgi:hypothetical protein
MIRRESPRDTTAGARYAADMLTFLVWVVLFVLCWPLALAVLVLYPFVWLLLLPLRILGITVDAVLTLLRTILLLPVRLLGGPATLRR